MVPSVDPPAPVLVEGELEYIVEKIWDSRVSRRKLQYLVKWKGYAQEDNSWVFASDVHAPDLVRAFHVAHPGRPGGSVNTRIKPSPTRDKEKREEGLALCTEFFKGAWWFYNCYHSHLNGRYLKGENVNPLRGVVWINYKGNTYSLKSSEMKFRPTKR
ncbi:unnamed protein product [Ranitomeya imitator]|uniref:Chromo domain-containing protein n=1 Tax=Ranitomeya imitator TaxID=111125 RepID=A0ABN9LT62_9NEOB|nr:unnamed protein product [Ranitomeya imitator]